MIHIKSDEGILSKLVESLPELKQFHDPRCRSYNFFQAVSSECVDRIFGKDGAQVGTFGALGLINLPYFTMGAINSTHLFGLDELIIFSFYLKNRHKYKKVADLGANIGLHTIVMSRIGFDVISYEPDPTHFVQLTSNIELNNLETNPDLRNKAISAIQGEMEFVRVMGNTTGSHLAGSKDSPYGELEKFPVAVDGIQEIFETVDFVKIDVEGHENVLLLATELQNWINTDAIVEVGSEENAIEIFEHFKKINVNLFSQKTAWSKVNSVDNMPKSYKEGSLFISVADDMPW